RKCRRKNAGSITENNVDSIVEKISTTRAKIACCVGKDVGKKSEKMAGRNRIGTESDRKKFFSKNFLPLAGALRYVLASD
ncbi:MAG: hypothetical protein ILP04_06830, partial [Bacteroidales bacterium]|nr:hypothetical protein [Bacteroidales bacterium]